MFKQIHIFIFLLLSISNSIALAQDKPVELLKNPFSQPDFLKYKAPTNTPKIFDKIETVIPVFTLTATFISINGPMAVVNDNLLSIGEEVEGMRLIMVAEDSVRILYLGKKYDVQIDDSDKDKSHKIRLNESK